MSASDSQVVPSPPEPGLFARAVGMITAPTATFAHVIKNPRPAGILLLVCVVMGLGAAVPVMTEAGRRANVNMQVEQMERFTGQPATPEMYAQLEGRARYAPVMAFVGTFVALPVFSVFFTGIYWFAFNVILGGTATFKQALGIVTHSQVISALGAILAAPIQLVQTTQSMAGPFNLGALAPMLAPDHPLALLLGALTFFQLWQTVVTGLGFAALYRRKPLGIIIALLIFLLAVTALFAIGLSSLFSSNR